MQTTLGNREAAWDGKDLPANIPAPASWHQPVPGNSGKLAGELQSPVSRCSWIRKNSDCW